MNIDVYERFFLRLTGLTLVIFFAAIVVSALAGTVTLPQPSARVDPSQLASTAPFDKPGVRELAPGRYEVAIVAQAWSFTPNEIHLPAGAEVTFRVTSRDVIHGFEITGVALNMMLIPGQVSVATTSFDEPGQHLIICHEYCGIGHQNMYATIIVDPPQQARAE